MILWQGHMFCPYLLLEEEYRQLDVEWKIFEKNMLTLHVIFNILHTRKALCFNNR